MLTKGFFRLGHNSPAFEGFHNPAQRWDHWATPSFGVDQVDRIIAWVMSSPDPGEALSWDGPTLVHRLGEAEPGRTVRINPNRRGRYRIGNRIWTWIEVSAPTGTTDPGRTTDPVNQQSATASTRPKARATEREQILPTTTPAVQVVSPQHLAHSGDDVQRVGARTLLVRPTTRNGLCAGFDVFSGSGQRLTHADPFPARPTSDQLDSFVTMRKRGLDLLMAEHGLHLDHPHEQDLYALLHGTRAVPRYAALTRTHRTTFIDLHDDLACAVRSLRERAAQDRTCTSLGVQDLDGEFLPATAQVTITLETSDRAQNPDQAQTPEPRWEKLLTPSPTTDDPPAAHPEDFLSLLNGGRVPAPKAPTSNPSRSNQGRRSGQPVQAQPSYPGRDGGDAGEGATDPASGARSSTSRHSAVLIDQLVALVAATLTMITIGRAYPRQSHWSGWRAGGRAVQVGTAAAPDAALASTSSPATSSPAATTAPSPEAAVGTTVPQRPYLWTQVA